MYDGGQTHRHQVSISVELQPGQEVTRCTVLRLRNTGPEFIRRVYANEPGPARDIVALNAGAALYLCDFADSIGEGYSRANELIASGAAQAAFERHIQYTQSIETDTP